MASPLKAKKISERTIKSIESNHHLSHYSMRSNPVEIVETVKEKDGFEQFKYNQ